MQLQGNFCYLMKIRSFLESKFLQSVYRKYLFSIDFASISNTQLYK